MNEDDWTEGTARLYEERGFSRDVGFGDTPALVTESDAYTHAHLLAAARTVEYDADDVVAVRAPLAEPGTVVSGVVAPLLAGAAILLPSDDATGTVAVTTDDDAPEDRTVSPSKVSERL